MPDYDRTKPLGTEDAALLDDRCRDNFAANEDRLDKEHYFPENSDVNQQGRHKFLAGDNAGRDSNIPGPQIGNVFFNNDSMIVQQRGSGGWNDYKGYGYGSEAARDVLAASGDLPDGYVWILPGASILWVWNGSSWDVLSIPVGSIPGAEKQSSLYVQTFGGGGWTEVRTAVSVPLEVTADSAGYPHGIDLTARLLLRETSGETDYEVRFTWTGAATGNSGTVFASRVQAGFAHKSLATYHTSVGAGTYTFQVEIRPTNSIILNDVTDFGSAPPFGISDLEAKPTG